MITPQRLLNLTNAGLSIEGAAAAVIADIKAGIIPEPPAAAAGYPLDEIVIEALDELAQQVAHLRIEELQSQLRAVLGHLNDQGWNSRLMAQLEALELELEDIEQWGRRLDII